MFEFGDRPLSPVDTLPGFLEDAPSLLLTGTIYRPDGVTPAEGVVLYVHQTNSGGVYPTRGDETGWGRRHGYMRGWIRTDSDGRYAFYTVRPGSYPNRSLAAHIHGTILEPDGRYYWIDDWNFVGDPLLTADDLDESVARGGSGVVEPRLEDGLLVAERNIVLGLRVPGYSPEGR